MNEFFISLARWVHSHVQLIPYTFIVILVAAGGQWLGDPLKLLTAKLLFITMIFMIYVVSVYFMFEPIGVKPSGWLLARLPYSLRVTILIIEAAIGFLLISLSIVLTSVAHPLLDQIYFGINYLSFLHLV